MYANQTAMTSVDAPPVRTVVVIACGALAHELTDVVRHNQLIHVRLRCLPPELHNRPDDIPAAVEALLEEVRPTADDVFVAYGDCGTGGRLDAVLERFGVSRLPGAHCYEFLSGASTFERLHDEEPGTFYLTDFLARHFERLVIKGLGLDRHPELMSMYFGHYQRVVYLSQRTDAALLDRATHAANRLGLHFEHCPTGLKPLQGALVPMVSLS
ncbi:MAG: DUF1638 domain-containing protein [Pseudomonadota bacterium]